MYLPLTRILTCSPLGTYEQLHIPPQARAATQSNLTDCKKYIAGNSVRLHSRVKQMLGGRARSARQRQRRARTKPWHPAARASYPHYQASSPEATQYAYALTLPGPTTARPSGSAPWMPSCPRCSPRTFELLHHATRRYSLAVPLLSADQTFVLSPISMS